MPILEWDRTLPLPADHRGAYARAVRDPTREIHHWIFWAEFAGKATLREHAERRGRMFAWVDVTLNVDTGLAS